MRKLIGLGLGLGLGLGFWCDLLGFHFLVGRKLVGQGLGLGLVLVLGFWYA